MDLPHCPSQRYFLFVTEDKHWEKIPLYVKTGVKREKKAAVGIYIFMTNMV